MLTIPIYTGSIGINNTVAPHRLSFDKETGVAALEAATDVLIDRTGEIVTLGGTTLIESGDFQHVFPGDNWGLVAKNRTSDTAIYQVLVSEIGAVTLNGILSGLTKGALIDFCRVNNSVFMTNTFMTCMITEDGVVVAWTESTWANSRGIKGFIAPPSIGIEHLGYNAGRIYFSTSDSYGKHLLQYTEYGHLGLYDPATNGEQFESKILAIAPAADGLYVSDRKAIYFLSGLNPHKWTSKKVTDYPAKEWGKFHGVVDPSRFGLATNIPASLLATKNGPVICLPGGQVVNLIDKKVIMSDCPNDGAIAVFDETLIIQCFE